MASNVSKGASAKAKSKKWLQARGYTVGDLEIVRWVYKSGRPAFAVKKDQWGADLLALGHNVAIFVQCKSGESARGGTFPSARREFAAFTFPAHTRQIVMGWPPQARVPRIVEVFRDGSYQEVQAV